MPRLQQAETLHKTDGGCQLPCHPHRVTTVPPTQALGEPGAAVPTPARPKDAKHLNICCRKRQPKENKPGFARRCSGGVCKAMTCPTHVAACAMEAAGHKTSTASVISPFWATGCKPAAPEKKQTKKISSTFQKHQVFPYLSLPQTDTPAAGYGSRRSLSSSAGKVTEDPFAAVGGTGLMRSPWGTWQPTPGL